MAFETSVLAAGGGDGSEADGGGTARMTVAAVVTVAAVATAAAAAVAAAAAAALKAVGEASAGGTVALASGGRKGATNAPASRRLHEPLLEQHRDAAP